MEREILSMGIGEHQHLFHGVDMDDMLGVDEKLTTHTNQGALRGVLARRGSSKGFGDGNLHLRQTERHHETGTRRIINHRVMVVGFKIEQLLAIHDIEFVIGSKKYSHGFPG